MNKAYSRIDWENYPSINTPINETNLNKMDAALDEVDNRLIAHDTEKASKIEVATLVADVRFDESTGIFTVQKKNGATYTIDTKLEKITTNWTFDKDKQQIILTLDDGTKQYIDLSALITQYEFLNSDTIVFVVQADGKIKAEIPNGSITESKLQPNYLAQIKVETAKSQTYMNNANQSATQAKSYAVGGTGTRTGEDTDNAKYYYEQAKRTDIGQLSGEVAEINSNLTDLAFGENSGSANIFNGKIVGGLLVETGEVSGFVPERITSDFIPVEPNTLYTQIAPTSAKGGRYCEYDANKNLVYFDQDGLQDTFTTKPTTKYLRISFGSEYGTTFKNDIAIIKGNATEYVPYIPSVKMLASENAQQTTEAMDLKMLGWTVPSECPIQNYVDSDGVFHQRVGRVDLGELDWSSATEYGRREAKLSKKGLALSKPIGYSVFANVFCSKYSAGTYNLINGTTLDNIIGFYKDGDYVEIRDTSKKYMTVAEFKNAMQCVYLYYELADEKTIKVDGNEAVTKVNDSLDDYGLVNKFDGNVKQGFMNSNNTWNTTKAYAGATTPISVKNGDRVRFVYAKVARILRLTFIGSSNKTSNTLSSQKEFNFVAPEDGVVYVSVSESTEDQLNTNWVSHIGVYVNNAIDELKNDLDGLPTFNNIDSVSVASNGSLSITVNGSTYTFYPDIATG